MEWQGSDRLGELSDWGELRRKGFSWYVRYLVLPELGPHTVTVAQWQDAGVADRAFDRVWKGVDGLDGKGCRGCRGCRRVRAPPL